MNNPRSLITLGVAMIAAAVLFANGLHGFWWLFGLAWAFGLFGQHGRRGICGHRASRRREPRDQPRDLQPDPSRDTHTAFPAR